MRNVHISFDENNLAIVWLDVPGKSVNTISPRTLEDLAVALSEIEIKNPAGVIFASAKPDNFIAGADLFAMRDMDAASVESFIRDGQAIAARIEKLSMPTVAAINGDCLGGGLEMALACRHRVAADDSSIKIGLPETKLGIVPGFGGTVRLTRAVGMTSALGLMLAGKTLPPRKAVKAGMIDEVVRPEALMDAARRWAKSSQPAKLAGFWNRAVATLPLTRRAILHSARKRTLALTHGHYPAATKLLDVVETGLHGGPHAGFEAERGAILELMQTDACKNLMRIFFLRQGAKKAAMSIVHAEPRPVKRAAVVGGGTMGAGIVHTLISAGIPVRLLEVSDAALSAGLVRIKAMIDDDVRAGRIDKVSARHTFNRVAPTTQWDGLKLCDFAIEAVVEKIEVKRQVFARLEKILPDHAVIASNTSSLRISDMAQAVANPQRVVGMHFFNPVSRMPLVEIVRGPQSGDEALATAIALAGMFGKTPVLVRDTPGFLVNRVLIPYLAEAGALAREHVDIARIDTAMKQFGWPMGPFELLDEIGLDVAVEVVKSLGSSDMSAWLAPAISRGWLGKKSGRGFYIHEKKKTRINPEMNTGTLAMEDSQIVGRLMNPMIAQAKTALAEEVVRTTDEMDLATVMGLGFPPFLGGLAKFAGLNPAPPLNPAQPANPVAPSGGETRSQYANV